MCRMRIPSLLRLKTITKRIETKILQPYAQVNTIKFLNTLTDIEKNLSQNILICLGNVNLRFSEV